MAKLAGYHARCGGVDCICHISFGGDKLVYAWRFVFRREARQADLIRLGNRKAEIRLELAKTRLERIREKGVAAIAVANAYRIIREQIALWKIDEDLPAPPTKISVEKIPDPMGMGAAELQTSREYHVKYGRMRPDYLLVVEESARKLNMPDLVTRFKELKRKWKPDDRILEIESSAYFPSDNEMMVWRSANRPLGDEATS